MRYPLEGIRVLDLSQMWAVPGSGMYLGDQGADVIKVEPPWGDEGRRVLTASPIQTEQGALNRHFLLLNRNKRGIAVDIRSDEGRRIVYRLVEWADVFLHNYRPEACKKLGYDYETLHQINPRIIYLDFTPYGPEGPYVTKPAYDRVVQAVSGVHGRRRLPNGTPLGAGVWVADCSSPILIAYGIALALLMREKTGVGQKVNTSLLAAAIAMQSVELVSSEKDVASPPRSLADQAMYSPYRCRDGEYLIIVIVSDREFAGLCKVLDIEHLATDSAFLTHEKRAENSDTLYHILEGIFATKPRDEWMRLLEEADLPAAPILRPADVFYHPQMLENELIIEVDEPRAGKVRMMGIPVKISGAPAEVRTLAPDLGQHTDEVLIEIGYTKTQIGQLRQKGIIC